MFRTRVAFALALSLVLAQSRLAPRALAQSQTPAAPPQTHAAVPAQKPDAPQQTAATSRPATPATPPQSQSPAPLDKHAEKIRRGVRRIGLSRHVTVIIEDGDDLHGTLTNIGEEDFDIAEVDQRRLVTVRYGDVKKVRSGYGRIAPLTGERTSHPQGLKIAAFAGLFALVAVPLIILATAKE